MGQEFTKELLNNRVQRGGIANSSYSIAMGGVGPVADIVRRSTSAFICCYQQSPQSVQSHDHTLRDEHNQSETKSMQPLLGYNSDLQESQGVRP
jgi:hypothetical protein